MTFIRKDVEFDTEWFSAHSVAMRAEGRDLVHIKDIDTETGTATVTVFKSGHPEAGVLFEGQINIYEVSEEEEQ